MMTAKALFGSAEQATGCYQKGKGLGKFYVERGEWITHKAARELFLAGEEIEVPNAGAGSYAQFFETLGFDTWSVWEDGSSAGDWTFKVRVRGVDHAAFQRNRYPYHGFAYSLGDCWDGTAA